MKYQELARLVKQEKIVGMRELIERSDMPYLDIVAEFQESNAMKQYREMFEDFKNNYAEKEKL